MLTGPIAGRLLEMLVWFGQPQRVLEIGTFSGHSALVDGGRAARRRSHRHVRARPDARRGRAALLRLLAATASASSSTSARRWRRSTASTASSTSSSSTPTRTGYVDYYEAVLPRLSRHGLIAVDNTLSSGRVLEGEGPIVRFNEHVRSDPRAVRVILSVRDGVTLIRRR